MLLNRKPKVVAPERLPDDPDAFLVDFTVQGTVDGLRRRPMGFFTVKVSPSWAPEGAKRFRELLEERFYDDTKIFEVMDGVESRGVKVAQGGIQGNPAVNKKWATNYIKDDPRLVSNKKGTICFAQMGPDQRTSQFLINLSDNEMFDGRGSQGMVRPLLLFRQPPCSQQRAAVCDLQRRCGPGAVRRSCLRDGGVGRPGADRLDGGRRSRDGGEARQRVL